MRLTAPAAVLRFVREHRALLPVVASVAYVAAAALRAHDGAPIRPLALGLAAVTLTILARKRDKRIRATVWGLAIGIATLGADARGWLDLFGAAGAAVAFVTAARAVTQMQGAGGLGTARPPSPRLVLAGGGLVWALALASTALDSLGNPSDLARAPWAWTCAAALASGLGVG